MANKRHVPQRLVPGTENNLLQAFLEHIPDGVYFKDRESRFVRVSRSLADRFGLTPAEVLNKTDFDVFSSEHAEQAFADEQEIIRSGRPILEKEEKETWRQGGENWVLTTKLPLLDADGHIIGTMGISRDITEHKTAERELQQYRVRLEELVAIRTEELARTNELLREDIAARKRVEDELALKAAELARKNEELKNLSLIDDLTGLYNRRGFLTLADHRAKLAQRNKEVFFIAFLDLDGLKQINDTFGHQEGNRALVETAEVLKRCLRASDILARIGGDEFAVFITGADETEISGRIQHQLDARNTSSGQRYCLSLSVGIVSNALTEKPDVEALLAQADALMYQQKRNKGVFRVIQPGN
jgi:diguanylate cyclase (GGDEF)-like protein/PAS domain S-box-containing protein